MDDQELLQMMVAEPWERYRRANRGSGIAAPTAGKSSLCSGTVFRCIFPMPTEDMSTCVSFWTIARNWNTRSIRRLQSAMGDRAWK